MYKKKIKNWARTTSSYPKKYYLPKTEEQLVSIIKDAIETKTPIKVCGKRHSYNNIFESDKNGILISLKKFNKILNVNQKDKTVTFQAGASTPQLLLFLKKHNLTIPNLGTNIMDNFIGACSNGYNGSGITYQIQSGYIQALTLISGTGKKIKITKNDELFAVFGVNIGALGIITEVTIKCEESFKLHLQTERVNYTDFKKNITSLLKTNKHIKFIWAPHTSIYQLWKANETTKKQNGYWQKFKVYFWDGLIINSFLHAFLLYFAAINNKLIPKINLFLTNLLVPYKGELIYNSYWIYFLPHLLKQDTVEFAVPIEHTFNFFEDLQKIIEKQPFFVQTPIEIRFVKRDSFWLSPAFEKDVCYVGTKTHFLPLIKNDTYKLYFQAFNNLIEKYQGKPHWGKQLYMSKKYIKTHYPKWNEFWKVAEILDPNKLFDNAFLANLRVSNEELNKTTLSQKLTKELKSHKLL